MWIGYISIRVVQGSFLAPQTDYFYMELNDFYSQRKPGKYYPNLAYVDTHTLSVI